MLRLEAENSKVVSPTFSQEKEFFFYGLPLTTNYALQASSDIVNTSAAQTPYIWSRDNRTLHTWCCGSDVELCTRRSSSSYFLYSSATTPGSLHCTNNGSLQTQDTRQLHQAPGIQEVREDIPPQPGGETPRETTRVITTPHGPQRLELGVSIMREPRVHDTSRRPSIGWTAGEVHWCRRCWAQQTRTRTRRGT